ncbi:MAG: YceI family protein [Flavobacteriaceae bacterium]|nr:YceI family protein [Flavobacteriaceae bacterium]
MKRFLLYIACFFFLQGFAQSKYYTKSGAITFESSVPAFEAVKAINKKVTAILKDDGSIASLVLIKGFRFKVALMEEHFNENYIESSSLPKATFSGKIANFYLNDLSDKNKKYTITGEFTLREITKKITITATIKAIKNHIHLLASFKLNPKDFGINIPKIVRNKIAKEVDVYLEFDLKKK